MSRKRPLFSWREAILESGLPPTTRHVLLTLSCHMNDLGESCFPSTRRLSHETGLSERAVITHLRKAKELGWLKVGLHGFGGKRWKSHEYTVAIPGDDQINPGGTERGSAASGDEGTERRSAASSDPPVDNPVDNNQAGTEPHAQGTEPHDGKALNEVQSNSSVNSTENSSIAVPAQAAEPGQPGKISMDEQNNGGPEELFELGKRLLGSGGGA